MSERLVTVFGGSGFVGRHLVNRLAADGWRVRVAVRDVEAAKFLKPLGDLGQISLVPTNIHNAASVVRAVEGADAVVNLVGILYERKTPFLPRGSFKKTHVEAPGAIARAAKAAGVSQFVQMSILGASVASPSPNNRSRAEGEFAVKEVFPSAVIIRPSVIFGPEDDFYNRFAALARKFPVLPYFIKQVPTITRVPGGLPKISLYGNGGTRFQPVFVGDVAAAIATVLASHDHDGTTFELGGPLTYSFREVMEQVSHETRRNRLVLPVPLWLVRIASCLLQYLPVPPLTPDQVTRLEEDNVLTGGKPGLEALGIAPEPLESVLPTYLDNYRPMHRQIKRLGKKHA